MYGEFRRWNKIETGWICMRLRKAMRLRGSDPGDAAPS